MKRDYFILLLTCINVLVLPSQVIGFSALLFTLHLYIIRYITKYDKAAIIMNAFFAGGYVNMYFVYFNFFSDVFS